MRGRASTTGVPGTARRERMRGRLGIGTEGVYGRWHGPRMLPAGRNGNHNWLFAGRAPHPLGESRLERERACGAREIDRGGERPEQQRPMLEQEGAGAG